VAALPALPTALLAAPPAARPATVAVSIDAGADRHAIDPMVYGVNFADTGRLAVVPYPLNRWGGNATTRYNWKVDTHSVGSDWYFMNFANDDTVNESLLPDGSSADQFLAGSLAGGAQPILTVPLIGWTPKWEGLTVAQARERRWSFSIDKYGAQVRNECTDGQGNADWCQAPDHDPPGNNEIDAGDGRCNSGAGNCQYVARLDDTVIVGNDPLDASDPIAAGFVTDWMAHVAGNLGTAAQGGVRFYGLDNEVMLWNSTHRDVHPQPLTYDDLWARTLAIAAPLKTQDPAARTLGPDTWGWCDIWTSASDSEGPGDNCTDGPDNDAHGNVPLLEWYLDKVCDHEEASGVRLVDVLDLHYYPQGDCVAGLGWGTYDGGAHYVDCGDPANDALFADVRLRALKELYDPAWNAESWIGLYDGRPVKLIPRMRAIRDTVAARCPGIDLALTEYRWGADDGRTSALAQAEALAIFGREGLDMATRWTAPGIGTASEDAFRLFLDYDAATAGFQQVHGDSVRATSALPDTIGAYAVRGNTDRLYVLLFNHGSGSNTASVTFASAMTGPAALWRFDPAAGAGTRITAQAPVALGGGGTTLSVALPARTAALAIVQIPSSLIFRDAFEAGLVPWSSHT
jgi:hypothetical protein